MKKIEPMDYGRLGKDAREVSEYAHILQGFTYLNPDNQEREYKFFKNNYEEALFNKISLLEKTIEYLRGQHEKD